MLKIRNTNAFDFVVSYYTTGEGLWTLVLNLYPSRHYVQEQHVRKDPFSTIVIVNIPDEYTLALTKSGVRNFIESILNHLGDIKKITLHNLYRDQSYHEMVDEIKQHTNDEFIASTVIVKMDAAEEEYRKESDGYWINGEISPNIVIDAIPTNGIVLPIPRSVQYKLYNGAFLHIPPTSIDYGRIHDMVYLFGEVFHRLSITYLALPKNNEIDPRKYIWGLEITHTWSVQRRPLYPMDDDKMSYLQDTGFIVDDRPKLNHSITPNQVLYTGNSKLFHKTGQNLFHLSDYPEEYKKFHTSM